MYGAGSSSLSNPVASDRSAIMPDICPGSAEGQNDVHTSSWAHAAISSKFCVNRAAHSIVQLVYLLLCLILVLLWRYAAKHAQERDEDCLKAFCCAGPATRNRCEPCLDSAGRRWSTRSSPTMGWHLVTGLSNRDHHSLHTCGSAQRGCEARAPLEATKGILLICAKITAACHSLGQALCMVSNAI